MQRRQTLAAVLALAAAPLRGAPAASGAPVVTPQDFGAVGNGEADDTRALQRALDRAREIGGELHLTPGVYGIGEYLQVRHGVRAILGRGGVIACRPGPQDAGLLLAGIAAGEPRNVRGLRVEGLVIDAGHRSRSVNAIHGHNCSDCEIRDNRVLNLSAGSGVLIQSLAAGRDAARGNRIEGNRIQGIAGASGVSWWGIRLHAPPRFEPGFSTQEEQWKARFVASDAALPIVNHVVRGNEVTGGYYGIWLVAARDCTVQGNRLEQQVRSLSIQDCSRANRITGNECLESLSSAIHLAYGAAENEIRGNQVRSARAEGEGLLQAYVGVRENLFVDNAVHSLGSPRYLVYCAVHAVGNEFRANDLHGPARRAHMALESAWNGWSIDPTHYGFLKGTAVAGFARSASADNRWIGNRLDSDGEAPALCLAQLGGTGTPLLDCLVQGNEVTGTRHRTLFQATEATRGQLRGLRLVDNHFPPGAPATKFIVPEA
jgi:parallel beta-helix repeat protein